MIALVNLTGHELTAASSAVAALAIVAISESGLPTATPSRSPGKSARHSVTMSLTR
jgi:hypothetical protein